MLKKLTYLLFLLIMAVCLQGNERKIYTARHCQTLKGKSPIADDFGVTNLGLLQARKLGQALLKRGFNGKIYASPYFRTMTTACLAASGCGLRVYPDARIQEHVGTLGGNIKGGGATLNDLRALFPDQIALDAKLDYPWMLLEPEEYEGNMQVRIEAALDAMLKESDGDILLVTHAGAVEALNRILGKRCGKKITDGAWNCALFEYSLDEAGNWHYNGCDTSFMDEKEVTSNKYYRTETTKDDTTPKDGLSYNFFFFSDPHLGTAESYDMNPETNPRFRTKKDIHRSDKALPTYRAFLKQMAQMADDETQFLIECGDLIEGGTFGEETHAGELDKALKLLKEYCNFPIYPVNGNHDAWGKGGPEAFKRVICKHASELIGREIKDTNYTLQVGPDVFIFTDFFSKESAPWDYIWNAIDTLKTKPRYLFIVMHPGFVPDPLPESIKRLERLAANNAIILCGDSHLNQLLDCKLKDGRLTQLMVVSIFHEDSATDRFTPPSDDHDAYWTDFEKKVADNPEWLETLRNYWRPVLKRLWRTKGNGGAKIMVSDQGVYAIYQSADLTQKPLVLKVRD